MGRDPRVVFVDDNQQFAEVAVERLTQATACKIHTVTDANTVVESFDLNDVDCIISDYNMPGMNGLELLEAVRKERSDIPFILVTGRGEEETAIKAIRQGVTDYVKKSGSTETFEVLANRIENAVEAYRSEQIRNRQVRAMEAVRDGISILEDGTFTYVNEAFAQLYEYEPESLIGSDWRRLYPDEETDWISDEVLPTVYEEGYWRGETTGLRSDGTTFVEDHVLTVSKEGELICTVRDITPIKEYEQQLERQRDDLKVLNEIVRHDLRNHLQLIVALAETGRTTSEEAHEYFDQIETSASYATDLTKAARELANVMLEPDAELGAVPIDTTLRTQVTAIEESTAADIQLEEPTPDIAVTGDGMLESVFRNLFKNAIQHNDKEVPRVRVSLEVHDDSAVVEVRDNGPGVPDAIKDDIFKKGKKGLQTGGTGIGLYLVEMLVDRYDGQIAVKDNDPEETVFAVELPVAVTHRNSSDQAIPDQKKDHEETDM